MKEKIENIKEYISEHKDELITAGFISGAAISGFIWGRSSVIQHVEAKTTWTDKDGLIVKEQFIGIIK